MAVARAADAGLVAEVGEGQVVVLALLGGAAVVLSILLVLAVQSQAEAEIPRHHPGLLPVSSLLLVPSGLRRSGKLAPSALTRS